MSSVGDTMSNALGLMRSACPRKCLPRSEGLHPQRVHKDSKSRNSGAQTLKDRGSPACFQPLLRGCSIVHRTDLVGICLNMS